MEVKEVFTLENPVTGRGIKMHLSEKEHIDVMQAGLFYLMQQGYINFKSIQQEVQDIPVPEGATAQ
jgi:hypothetical protein